METIQLCPTPIRESIAIARTAIEDATQIPPAHLDFGAEVAEVMGALTEDPVLATAVLAKPAVGLPGVTPEKLARLVGSSAADIALALVRLFAWNMPYHSEHHAYPAVPFHALPRLHGQVRGRIEHLEPGYVAATGKVNRHLFGRPASILRHPG